MTDRRITPATDRIALDRLRGVLDRPHYTAGNPARIAAPVTDLCASPQGPRDRQLNFGANVTVIDTRDGWSFVQAQADGYCGWVAGDHIVTDLPEITHHVSAPATHLYPAPDLKQHEITSLSINARLSVVEFSGRFARLATGGWVPVQHISDQPASDPVIVAQSLLGTPYLWGGNSRWGIDCSGLVQAAFGACGRPCPGDTDLQQAAFDPVSDPERGDVLFWPGHVAMAVDDKVMIHATAYAMAVIHEPIKEAIARIDAAGEGPFRGFRRPLG